MIKTTPSIEQLNDILDPPLQCPTNTVWDETTQQNYTGCGSTNLSAPNEIGEVDCLDCHMWFTPAREVR